MSPHKLIESRWLLGPEFLCNPLPQPHHVPRKISLDVYDPEVKQEAVVYATKLQVPQNLGCSRFKRLSSEACGSQPHLTNKGIPGEIALKATNIDLSPLHQQLNWSTPARLQSKHYKKKPFLPS